MVSVHAMCFNEYHKQQQKKPSNFFNFAWSGWICVQSYSITLFVWRIRNQGTKQFIGLSIYKSKFTDCRSNETWFFSCGLCYFCRFFLFKQSWLIGLKWMKTICWSKWKCSLDMIGGSCSTQVDERCFNLYDLSISKLKDIEWNGVGFTLKIHLIWYVHGLFYFYFYSNNGINMFAMQTQNDGKIWFSLFRRYAFAWRHLLFNSGKRKGARANEINKSLGSKFLWPGNSRCIWSKYNICLCTSVSAHDRHSRWNLFE